MKLRKLSPRVGIDMGQLATGGNPMVSAEGAGLPRVARAV
jgi:hypothetical protein